MAKAKKDWKTALFNSTTVKDGKKKAKKNKKVSKFGLHSKSPKGMMASEGKC